MKFIVTKLEEPCYACGKLTDLFEVNLEVRVCCKECFKKLKEK